MDEATVARRLREARQALHGRRNVVATGVGYKVSDGVRTGELSIVCSVTEKVPLARLAAADRIPPAIGEVATDVVATGVLRALAAPTDRHRPAPGGVSIGHPAVTAGTLGCLVYRDGEPYILSNNHVLADENRARIGDPILQPGAYDGGRSPEDAIAVLADFVPVRMAEEASSCAFARASAAMLNAIARALGSGARLHAVSAEAAENLVDCAIARPIDDAMVSAEIVGLGMPTGVADATLGTAVRKSGRTTGVTSGEIVQVDVTADIRFGATTARFTDQLMAGAMSQGGDSGSAVLDAEGRLVGLLFAGSENTTLVNRSANVLAALGVTL
ncbi:MAG: hypothetical protein Kow0067_15540 [Coriobacteriia bacterium]